MLNLHSTILDLIANKRKVAVLLLGFSSGLPYLLSSDTMQVWMHDLNFTTTTIGLFWLATLPYSLKLLWAPLVDRYSPPFLGRRRGWLLISQLAVIFSICLLALSPSPFSFPFIFFLLTVLLTSTSATQDIVVDAYRAEILHKNELGPGASLGVIGYQAGLLVSGAAALFIADQIHYDVRTRWRIVFFAMSALLLIGVFTTLKAKEPHLDLAPPRTLKEAVVMPFIEFFKMKGSLELFVFIFLYKLGLVLATALVVPFLLGLAFTKTDLGTINKGWGLVATMAGTAIGGALIPRLKLFGSLLVFGILQMLAILPFMLLAHLGHSYSLLVFAITSLAFFGGMGTAAYIAFLMSICNIRFTATQYAFFTSLLALSRTIIKSPSGYLYQLVGWEGFFLVAALVSVPGLLLLVARYRVWGLEDSEVKSSG